MAETNPERWLAEYGDILFRFAVIRVRNHVAAEDLVQETFLAALKAKDRFAGRSTEKSWLVGILKHKILDFFRRKSKDKIFTPEGELEDATGRSFDSQGHWDVSGGMAPRGWGRDASGAFEREEFKVVLENCLNGLPPKTARAFTLREMDDLGTEDICKILNITATNLWVVLHRARMQLRRCLEMNGFAK